MSFDFECFDDEKIESFKVKLEKGEWDFEVINAEEGIGKKSNLSYMRLDLRIWGQNGQIFTLSHYLSSHEKMRWQIKNFFKSTGWGNTWDINSNRTIRTECLDFIGKVGRLKSDIDKEGKAVVVDFLAPTHNNSLNVTKNQFTTPEPVDPFFGSTPF